MAVGAVAGVGKIGFTVVFVLFALVHCAATEGLRRTAVFFAVSAVVSYLMEEIGVRTGLVYGAYHYSDLLGAKLGHVPVLIPLAWFMMIYPSWTVARGDAGWCGHAQACGRDGAGGCRRAGDDGVGCG